MPSLTTKEAVRIPTPDGVNVTENEQLAAAASVDPHVVATENSGAFAPVIEVPPMASGVLPAFERVTV